MGLNQNPFVDDAEPHRAEVILISDTQMALSFMIWHLIGPRTKRV